LLTEPFCFTAIETSLVPSLQIKMYRHFIHSCSYVGSSLARSHPFSVFSYHPCEPQQPLPVPVSLVHIAPLLTLFCGLQGPVLTILISQIPLTI
jgi:hypothetical protein